MCSRTANEPRVHHHTSDEWETLSCRLLTNLLIWNRVKDQVIGWRMKINSRSIGCQFCPSLREWQPVLFVVVRLADCLIVSSCDWLLSTCTGEVNIVDAQNTTYAKASTWTSTLQLLVCRSVWFFQNIEFSKRANLSILLNFMFVITAEKHHPVVK